MVVCICVLKLNRYNLNMKIYNKSTPVYTNLLDNGIIKKVDNNYYLIL